MGERWSRGERARRRGGREGGLSHIGSTRGSSFVSAVVDMILNDLKLFLNLYLF